MNVINDKGTEIAFENDKTGLLHIIRGTLTGFYDQKLTSEVIIDISHTLKESIDLYLDECN